MFKGIAMAETARLALNEYRLDRRHQFKVDLHATPYLAAPSLYSLLVQTHYYQTFAIQRGLKMKL